MASTYTLQETINFASGFLKLRPMAGIGGTANEPSLTISNMVMQTMLGAPFVWRWNRQTFTLPALTSGTQDYKTALANFGYLEKTFLSSASGNSIDLETKLVLSSDSTPNRPNYIAPQIDDGAGNITFRFMPVPDAAYVPTVVYQAKAPLLTALTQTWNPIPDELGYIYNMGYLAFAYMYASDARFPFAMQRFLGSLVGVSEGLTEQQKDLFLGNWIPAMQQMGRANMLTQMGMQARMGA